jgi:MFS family permease
LFVCFILESFVSHDAELLIFPMTFQSLSLCVLLAVVAAIVVDGASHENRQRRGLFSGLLGGGGYGKLLMNDLNVQRWIMMVSIS